MLRTGKGIREKEAPQEMSTHDRTAGGKAMSDCYKCKNCKRMGGFFNSLGCVATNPVTNLNQMQGVITFLQEVGCQSFEQEHP
jgi:hypothetical protein